MAGAPGVPALPSLTGGAGGNAGPAVSGPLTFTGGTINVGTPMSQYIVWASFAAIGFYLWTKLRK